MLGMLNVWPTRMTVLVSPFALWMASTDVLYLRDMPQRLSPATTVCVVELAAGAAGSTGAAVVAALLGAAACGVAA